MADAGPCELSVVEITPPPGLELFKDGPTNECLQLLSNLRGLRISQQFPLEGEMLELAQSMAGEKTVLGAYKANEQFFVVIAQGAVLICDMSQPVS